MRKPLPYRVVRKSTVLSAPDIVLSQHHTLEAAQRAFDCFPGRAVLIGPGGAVLNHRIV